MPGPIYQRHDNGDGTITIFELKEGADPTRQPVTREILRRTTLPKDWCPTCTHYVPHKEVRDGEVVIGCPVPECPCDHYCDQPFCPGDCKAITSIDRVVKAEEESTDVEVVAQSPPPPPPPPSPKTSGKRGRKGK